MDETLGQLGELLLGSVPTVILLTLLFGLYSAIVHNPLQRVLAERRSKTEGAVEKAQADIAAAGARTTEYEQRLREARATVFRSQEARRQALCHASSVQAMCHMFAVGPPMSLTIPVHPGTSLSDSISRSTLASLRETTSRPWCSVMQQNEQPAAQPRMMVTLKRICSHAGMRASAYMGCGTRVNGNSYSASICSVVGGTAADCERSSVRI